MIKWINAKNELPNTTRDVIGCNIHTRQVFTCRLWEKEKNHFLVTQTADDGSGNYEATENITHWTELELPTE